MINTYLFSLLLKGLVGGSGGLAEGVGWSVKGGRGGGLVFVLFQNSVYLSI